MSYLYIDDLDEEEKEELEDEMGGFGEVEFLIPEDEWRRYAEDVASSLYDIPDYWPYTCIDWEQAADDLRADYSIVEFQGVTYYYQCF